MGSKRGIWSRLVVLALCAVLAGLTACVQAEHDGSASEAQDAAPAQQPDEARSIEDAQVAAVDAQTYTGEPITPAKLQMVARAERVLTDEGFAGARVRAHGDLARIEVAPSDIERLAQNLERFRIAAAIHQAGFAYVTMDLDGYRMGSLNEVVHGQ